MPAFALIFGQVVDSFDLPPDELFDEITRISLIFLYIGAGAFVVVYIQQSFWAMTGLRQIERIRAEYLRSILSQEIGWFDTQDSGELSARVAGDTVVVQEAMGEKVGSAIQFISTFLAGFVVGFIIGWKLTLVILAVAPLLAAGAATFGSVLANLTTKSQTAYAKAGSVASEVIGGIRTVSAFGGEEREIERYSKNLEEARKLGNRRGLFSGVSLGVTLFVMFATYGLALWFGSRLVIDEELTGGEVLTVFFSVLIGAFSLGQAGPSLEAIQKGRGAAFAIFQTIDRKSLIDPFSKEGKVLSEVTGKIELRNVTFHYPTRPEVTVLSDFSLTIREGQTVALVGESGCGKSSVVQLLQRFYDPQEGSVRVDGVNISTLNPKWWREQIGLVGQEPVLFSGSIAQNIAYGKPNASREEIETAAKAANAYSFISSFPKGYDTQVGEKGTQLSGGQKQRIAIARAMVRDPSLLLLDEATSALDSESEKIVQEALESASEGRTTLIIAHRLSTIRHVDLICVIDKGQVVEKGTHEELMEEGGRYAKMVKAQGGGKHLESGETSHPHHDIVAAEQREEIVASEEKKEETRLPKVSLARIFRLNAPEWPYLLGGVLSAIPNGAFNPIFALIFAEIVTLYFQPEDQIRSDAPFLALAFVGLGVIPLVFNSLQAWMFAIAGGRLTARLRRMTFQSIVAHPPSWFDSEKNSTGILTSRLSRDATLVEGLVGTTLGLQIQNFVTLVTGLVIAFIYGWRLALVIVAGSPAIVLANAMEMMWTGGLNEETMKANEGANQMAGEAIGNMRTVASFTQEQALWENYVEKLHKPTVVGLKKAHVTALLMAAGEGLLFAVYFLGFWYGGKLVNDGLMDFSDVLVVFTAIVLAAMTIGQNAALAPDSTKAKAAAGVIFALIDDQPLYSPFSKEGTIPSQATGDMELSNVEFSYPSRPEAPVLRKLSIQAHHGQTIALVGESGCGKSSTISLLERFYDPNEGRVTFDGVDIRELNLRWYREQLALVGQEPVLFSGSIAQNIAYGKPNASREEIETAAKAANAYSFISSFPKGYDTQVGEKGTQLSGGQKQRIAIARAMVRDPSLLLLDEATSALDSESEKIVQEALDEAMKGRTTVVIAHRLSTIRNADLIYVIDKGQVVEVGTHDELMERNGVYTKLAALQVA